MDSFLRFIFIRIYANGISRPFSVLKSGSNKPVKSLNNVNKTKII